MILGIDPGSVSGAFALIDMDCNIIEVGDLPVVDRQVNAAALFSMLDTHIQFTGAIHAAVIETVGAMPKQGIASTFRFGVAVGLIHGVVVSCHIPIHNVTPSKWKRFYNLDSDGEKSRAMAQRFWPQCQALSHKKDHGRAEALLLARYHIKNGASK
jgi:Holliday junction resolvasome RuvABC endonuclease subunit